MQIAPEIITSWLDIAVQVIILVVPLIGAWLFRSYVRSSAGGNTIATISRMANAAIDYAENLDKRGDLQLPPEASKGAEKLRLASRWLSAELAHTGIRVQDTDARKWVAAEFQRRVGEVRPVATIAELAGSAVRMVQGLEQHRLISPPIGGDRADYLAGLAADWLVVQLAQQKGATIGRDEALTWVRAELVGQLQQQLGALPQGDRLGRLAQGAAAFLEQLKASGRLANTSAAMDADVATAWLLTEAARQGLDVDGAQIVAALEQALHPQLATPARNGIAHGGPVA